jgi:plastocyanin
MKSLFLIAILAAVALSGCTEPTIEYTTPDMDDQGRYVIPVDPDGTNVFGIKYAKVPVGATVVWTFEGGPEPHNVKADDASFDSEISNDAWEFEHTFDTAGTFGYFCVPHQSVGMNAEILVE